MTALDRDGKPARPLAFDGEEGLREAVHLLSVGLLGAYAEGRLRFHDRAREPQVMRWAAQARGDGVWYVREFTCYCALPAPEAP